MREFTGSEIPSPFTDLTGVAIDPTNGNVLVVNSGGNAIEEFASTGKWIEEIPGPSPTETFGHVDDGIGVNSGGYLYVADEGDHVVDIFTPAIALPKISIESVTNATPTSGNLNANINPNEGGEVTACRFEYGPTKSYGTSSACVPATPYKTPTSVSTSITGLSPETTYHYRVVATDANGTAKSPDQTFTPHAVGGVTTGQATNLRTTSATLGGSLVGNGSDTHYFFEYGPNTEYGQSTSEAPGADAGSTPGLQEVSSEVISLEEGELYHYRLVADNSFGTSYGQDATFTTAQRPAVDLFNSTNVTATGAELDARINPHGYETVVHFEYGPTIAYGASAPVPPVSIGSATTDTPVSVLLTGLEPGKTYHFRVVAESLQGTTTTKDQTFNFYPQNCPNETVRQEAKSNSLPDCRAYELVSPSNANGLIMFTFQGAAATNSPYATNPSRFAFGGAFGSPPEVGNPQNSLGIDTYISTRTTNGWVTKYVGIPGYESEGSKGIVGDLSFDKFMDFDEPNGGFGTHQPESNAPYVWNANGESLGRWPTNLESIPGGDSVVGAFKPSPEFTHLAFSSNNVAFAPEGLTTAPGSAYDNNMSTEEITIISKTASGLNIPQEPGNTAAAEAIQFPAVSTDGSHILMSTAGANGGTHLYMRVNDALTYDVSQGKDVNYVGMTADGSKVYFTSAEPLTPDDHDTSVDLYMWSEETDSLTLLSIGDNGAGNTDKCNASWTTACDVEAVTTSYRTDNAIAAESGDIYFLSPEKLDGSRGVVNEENLYDYRDGRVQYVTTFEPEHPLMRIQVSPDDAHAAFVTASQLTSYNNTSPTGVCSYSYGEPASGPKCTEMYSFEPSTGVIQCDSCHQNGEPPTSDTTASSNGLFMSNDGRTFFDTTDPLVPQDTNGLHDVYEFVEGRPQLITTGTGAEDNRITPNQEKLAGLVGVSANGVDVYFSTYETLVKQDHNGNFMKYYDARTDGGFAPPPSVTPCAAADECHGAGSAPPAEPQFGSNASLGVGSNVKGARTAKPKRHRRRRHLSRHHGSRRRGSTNSAERRPASRWRGTHRG